MSDANSDGVNLIDSVPTPTNCNKKPKISGNKVKNRIEQVFETMLDSLSSSEGLFVDIKSKTSANANVSNTDVDGQTHGKRLATKISFPGKNENEAWRFGNLNEDYAINNPQLC